MSDTRKEDRNAPFWTPWTNNTPPDATNDAGVKFWFDVGIQRYAKSRGITDVQCMFAETPDGHRSRIIARGQEVLDSSTSFEATACFLDMLAFAKDTDEPH